MNAGSELRDESLAVLKPTFLMQCFGWGVPFFLFFSFFVWPLYQGRFYGVGQVLFYCFLILLSAWFLHWTHKEIEIYSDRVVVRSKIHNRTLKMDGLHVEIRTGWWTRAVLFPQFGLPTSILQPFWGPDAIETLTQHLPQGTVRWDPSPGIDDPGPEEG